ncbi:MAG: FAD-binding oxidoreductase [Thermoleophilia bacterium]|nr:FAD-binding oxidoreductase [Thermoleophilia bacterium]
MAVSLDDQLATAMEGFAGTVIRPADAGYDDARRIFNAMIDRRPAFIARCQGVADVAAAVNFARENELEVTIRGGGHSVAGSCLADGAVLIDLSAMKGIHVDPDRRTARAQGGVTWRELNRETQLHGLAVTGGIISTTGIAGLTLGGGLGWMMGKYGLAVDNLVSAQLVTADARVLTASENENGDLFWALRGGGGNFGVVTSFEYRLHEVGPMVTGGLVVHPYRAARDVLRFYRDFTSNAPDELTAFAGLLFAPDGSGEQVAGVVLCHVGPPEQAQKDIEPLLKFGSPVMVQVGPMPYSAVNAMLDEAAPPGVLNYWKSSFLQELSDDAIDIMVESFVDTPSPMNFVLLEHFHGQVARVPVDATASPYRETGYNFIIPSAWTDPADTEANVAWTRETFAAVEPFLAKRRYVNYLDDDDLAARPTREAFGPNYDRLVEVKSRYDPTNFFRHNLNITPAM